MFVEITRIFCNFALTMVKIDQAAAISRIKFILKKMGLTQSSFARKLSMDPANMSKHLNGKLPISAGLLNRIAADLGVSKQWLVDGSGLPFAKNDDVPTIDSDEMVVVGDHRNGSATPVYDIDVTAGCLELSREFTNDRIIGYVDLPEVRPGAMLVRVYGDSMMPTIHDGAFIAIRRITDPSCIFWGQIYVVVLDDFRVVKHVRRHADPSMVILRSDNPLYDDMEVSRSKIRGLYLVETILNFKIQC